MLIRFSNGSLQAKVELVFVIGPLGFTYDQIFVDALAVFWRFMAFVCVSVGEGGRKGRGKTEGERAGENERESREQ